MAKRDGLMELEEILASRKMAPKKQPSELLQDPELYCLLIYALMVAFLLIHGT